MVEWHHRLDGYEFEQALEAGDGQGSLACCSPWGHRVRQDWATEQQPSPEENQGNISGSIQTVKIYSAF